MATTKRLTPTNVNMSIPEFTDKPDQRVNSTALGQLADAINAENQALANMHNSGALSNADCNAYTQNMTYRIGNVATLTNAPSGIGSTGVFKIDVYGAFILQYMDLNLGSAFRFSFDSGSTWTNWNVLALKSDIITDSLTPGTGVSIAVQRKLKIGNLVTYNLAITTTEQMQPHVSLVTGFEPHNGGYNGVPTILSFNNSSATAIFYLHDDGSLRAVSAFGASTWRMSFSYICN